MFSPKVMSKEMAQQKDKKQLKQPISYPPPFKGSGHYWKLLKISIGAKPFLVTNNGERLMV